MTFPEWQKYKFIFYIVYDSVLSRIYTQVNIPRIVQWKHSQDLGNEKKIVWYKMFIWKFRIVESDGVKPPITFGGVFSLHGSWCVCTFTLFFLYKIRILFIQCCILLFHSLLYQKHSPILFLETWFFFFF